MAAVDDVALVDQHCHALRYDRLDLATFTSLATESPWLAGNGTHLDGPVGHAIRRWAFPLLGLERDAPWHRYLDARSAEAPEALSSRMVEATNTSDLFVDTGYRGDELCTLDDLRTMSADRRVGEIVRIEPLAERVALASRAATFLSDFESALSAEVARPDAVGIKSVLAYRCGFDLDLVAATASTSTIESWLRSGRRMDDPSVCAELVRIAARVGGDLGRPLQFHVGYGDPDVRLHLTNPSLLTPFVEWCQALGTQIVLLHCWPYQREAGYLATVYPHVWADVGLSLHYSGPSAPEVLAEFFEMTPHTKLLYSSDAFGLAELYAAGAAQYRWSLGMLLDRWIERDSITAADAERIALDVSRRNALTVYGAAIAEPAT